MCTLQTIGTTLNQTATAGTDTHGMCAEITTTHTGHTLTNHHCQPNSIAATTTTTAGRGILTATGTTITAAGATNL